MSTHTYAPTPSNYVAGIPLAQPTVAPTEATSLSDGAIVGITIGVVVFAIVVLSVVLYLRSAKAAKKLAAGEVSPLMGQQRSTPAEMDRALGRNPAGSRPTVVSCSGV